MYKNYEKIRDAHGYTDYRVAKETGISTSTQSEWKNKVSKPKVDKLLKIAKLFGITLDELVGEGE